MAMKLLAPQVIEGVPGKIKLKRKKAKLYHDRKTKELPELKVGERVWVQPIHPKEMGRWKLGTSTEKVAPRSYTVDIQGRLYRRNCKFLRTTKEDKTLAEQMSQTIAEPPDRESEGAPSTAHSHKIQQFCRKISRPHHWRHWRLHSLLKQMSQRNKHPQYKPEPEPSRHHHDMRILFCRASAYQLRTYKRIKDISY